MDLYGPVSLLAIVVLGYLVIFRAVSLRGAGKFLVFLFLAILLMPIFLNWARYSGDQFFSVKHSWWEYVALFFAALVAVRLILNFAFPRRRK